MSRGSAGLSGGVLRLSAVTRGERSEATARVSDAIGEAGAWITDVHFFSGIQTTFAFEITADRLAALEAALLRAKVSLDRLSRERLAGAAADTPEEVQGTLAVTFAEGDPDLKHEVPTVPG
jgi:hypothetical protein